MILNRIFLLAAVSTFLVGYFAQAEIVIGGDNSDCSIFTDGLCISCPPGCQVRATGTPGGTDFVCNCKCDDGSQKKCVTSDAPAPVAEKAKEKLEESKEKLEESKEKLEESKEKLEESKEKLGK